MNKLKRHSTVNRLWEERAGQGELVRFAPFGLKGNRQSYGFVVGEAVLEQQKLQGSETANEPAIAIQYVAPGNSETGGGRPYGCEMVVALSTAIAVEEFLGAHPEALRTWSDYCVDATTEDGDPKVEAWEATTRSAEQFTELQTPELTVLSILGRIQAEIK
jgi:hypothetical protein